MSELSTKPDRVATRRKLLVYGLNYAPELTGIGKYSGEMVGQLFADGYEVQVITAPPYYPDWQVFAGHSNWWSSLDVKSNGSLHVIRCPLWVPSKPTGLKRILHLLSFALSSLPIVIAKAFWRPDVVVVVAPAFACAPGGWLAARLCGAKAVLHIQDFEVDAAFSLGLLKNTFLRRVVLAIEGFVLRRFDRVSTISNAMLNRLSDKGVAKDRQLLFPNWVDTSHVFPLDAESPLRSMLGFTQADVIVLYSGNMGAKQGLDLLLDAALILVDRPDIKFILCGDGAERERLQAKYAGLGNVIWIPLQPLDELNNLLNAADIHALPQLADAADLVMPSKLTGMMASGRPTVASASAGTEIHAVVSGRGLVVPPGDSSAFAEAIRTLADSPEKRHCLGQVSREYAIAHFARAAILSRFERDLMDCIDEVR
ncbi:MAG: glycosyltransferase WbuB [Burkholderiales bacterium]